MKLIMTLLVRDEEDILSANIEYHLKQGVDFFIVTDNCSVDRTNDILKFYENRGLVHVIHEESDDYAQAQWVTRMTQLAWQEFSADWIIHSDADEFWWPEQGDLKTTLAAVEKDIFALSVTRNNFVPVAATEQDFFSETMLWREAQSLNSLGNPLPPKICHRAADGVRVGQGNHKIVCHTEIKQEITQKLEILHFPLRTYRQFENKIAKGGAAYAYNKKLGKNIGATWRNLYKIYLKNRLSTYYQSQLATSEKLAQNLATEEWLEDLRLRDFIRQHLGGAKQLQAATYKKSKLLDKLAKLWRKPVPQKGIVTLADAHYFPGLLLLYHSIQDVYPLPIVCFDLGLSAEQRQWAQKHLPDLSIRPIPNTAIIRAIQEKADHSPLQKTGKRQWPLWICPHLIAESPFQKVFWLDCDIAVLRHLRELFAALEDGPVFTPENNAPHKTPNASELYQLLPIERDFDPLLPTLNGGVSGWDLKRDRGILEAYQYPINQGFLVDERIREAISWHDQGALIWAVQNAGMEDRVMSSTEWNLCVKHTGAFKKPYRFTPPYYWDRDVLEQLRQDAPEANLLHWNGTQAPWLIGK